MARRWKPVTLTQLPEVLVPAGFSLVRFEEFGDLAPGELGALKHLSGTPRGLERGRVLRRVGDPVTGFFMLHEGWVLASVILPSGVRQVTSIYLPGEILGSASIAAACAVDQLEAITSVLVSDVSLDQFSSLVEEHPRLGLRILLAMQRQKVALIDRLASIGRTAADARIASLLLDLMQRLAGLQMVRGDTFDLLLTQEQIGDALGLTGIHVNRVFRKLEKMRLIARCGRSVTLLERDALIRMAGRPNRQVRQQPSWLPDDR